MRSYQYTRAKQLWRRQEKIILKLLNVYNRIIEEYQVSEEEELSNFMTRLNQLFLRLHSIFPSPQSSFRFAVLDIIDLAVQVRFLRKDSQKFYIQNRSGLNLIEINIIS